MADSLEEALGRLGATSPLLGDASSDVLIISNDLRTIALPEGFFFGVYSDKDVKVVPFKMDRYYDELDLSSFNIQINYENANNDGGIYYVKDPVIDTDTITFNWVVGRGVFMKEGTAKFNVCLRLIDEYDNVEKEFNTTIATAPVIEGLEIEDPSDPEAYSILAHMQSLEASTQAAAEVAEDAVSLINNTERELQAYVGAPRTALRASDMTDTDKIYVYTGNEEGYTFGNWYYYDGNSWVSGGIYNSTAFEVDETLTVTGMAADAKAAGSRLDTVAASASNAENEAAEAANAIKGLQDKDTEFSLQMASFVNDAYVENGVAYFTHDGEVVFSVTGIGGGGGGGGSDNNAVMTMTNTSGFLSKTISSGSSCYITFTWSSTEEEIPTGPGTMRVLVNNAVRANLEINQGNIEFDLGPYLSTGSNVVKISVSDIYGNSRTINFSISSVALSISSTFDTNQVYSGAIAFPYVPVGSVAKTTHIIVDGTEIGTQQTSVSGRQMTYTIPAQTHGAHKLRVYFEAEINGENVKSNELYYEFIAIESGVDTTVISSSYNEFTVPQYTSIRTPYRVYTPGSLTSEVTLSANGETVASLTVDRSEQSYVYKANDFGTLNFTIASGNVIRTLTITIEESEIKIEAETESLALYLSANGRSNQEANPGEWKYNDISATLSDFNFVSDGWQIDEDGITALRVAGDARVTIPYKMFNGDPRTTGKTIEIEFATRNVLNYDANIVSCMSENRGLYLTAQLARLNSEQSAISTQYKEDEHVRVAFVISKKANNRLLFIYINGVASGVVQYPDDDDFSQAVPADITIGSNDCTTDIYCIRVYDNDLTRHQIVNNWIADTQIGTEMMDRYLHNNVYDEYGEIVISKLPSDLPYLILEGPVLPQYKGDKKTIGGSYTDPVNPAKSFTFTEAQIDVQGTSSQYYPRKNYKIKFKNGFVNHAGYEIEKYAINDKAIATNTFTFKADVASSEGANNVELARLYNDACTYKTPAQKENSKIRQGIDGFPIVIFWNDGEETTFMGKYNFNNDKGTEEVFGFVDPDESWEIKNNTGDRVVFKSADYSGNDWLNDFEARYPDLEPAYENPEQLRTFAEWAVSTDPDQATNNALPEAVTYEDVEYTTDSAEYRLAKFKDEAGNYMELESAFFYYLFTELFLMVDSRAKNAFPSFMGSEVVGG